MTLNAHSKRSLVLPMRWYFGWFLMPWNRLSSTFMNPESSEIEALLRTPATLPLSPEAAPETATPQESSTRLPENVGEASGEATIESIATDTSSTDEAAPDTAKDSAPVASGEEVRPTEEAATNPSLTLRFSPAPDAPFQSSLTLNVFCDSPTAEIRYALGAETVDENAPLFNSKDKIFLTQTTLVSARAFENGAVGPLLSANFEIQKPQWKELEPTDQSDATPHKIGEFGACPDGWKVAAGSVRGKLHAHRALWREDSFALADVETESGVWSLIAVSDGAGSAPLSRVGSRIACEAALESLKVGLGEITTLSDDQETLLARDLPVLREILVKCGAAALQAIRAESQKRDKPLSAFAATLLVLARREWNGSQLCAALQVGDGAIALLDADGVTILGEAEHGQHSSETRFLTTSGVEDDLASRVKFSIKSDLVALAVMSDGVADDYFPEEKRLGEVFQSVLPLLQEAQPDDDGAVLIKWLGYEKKGSSDDRTLVVAWPAAPQIASSLQTEASNDELQAADSHAG